MNAQILAKFLIDLLTDPDNAAELLASTPGDTDGDADGDASPYYELLSEITSVASYGAAGVLTRDEGLVVYLSDGGELSITINRRR